MIKRIGLTRRYALPPSPPGKSIGNITFTGNVGSITANTLNNTNPGLFYGITGPIVVNGSVQPTPVTDPVTGNITQPTPVPGLTTSPIVSIGTINVGNGIVYGGSGAGVQGGIFTAGRINAITGSDGAVIRGVILTENSIGSINIANGSIIDARILDVAPVPPRSPPITSWAVPSPRLHLH